MAFASSGALNRVGADVAFPPFAVGAWLALVTAYFAFRARYAIDGSLARVHVQIG